MVKFSNRGLDTRAEVGYFGVAVTIVTNPISSPCSVWHWLITSNSRTSSELVICVRCGTCYGAWTFTTKSNPRWVDAYKPSDTRNIRASAASRWNTTIWTSTTVPAATSTASVIGRVRRVATLIETTFMVRWVAWIATMSLCSTLTNPGRFNSRIATRSIDAIDTTTVSAWLPTWVISSLATCAATTGRNHNPRLCIWIARANICSATSTSTSIFPATISTTIIASWRCIVTTGYVWTSSRPNIDIEGLVFRYGYFTSHKTTFPTSKCSRIRTTRCAPQFDLILAFAWRSKGLCSSSIAISISRSNCSASICISRNHRTWAWCIWCKIWRFCD